MRSDDMPLFKLVQKHVVKTLLCVVATHSFCDFLGSLKTFFLYVLLTHQSHNHAIFYIVNLDEATAKMNKVGPNNSLRMPTKLILNSTKTHCIWMQGALRRDLLFGS